MDSVSVDVLSFIIQRLPLQQKYQLLTVSHKFEEASSLALKEHESIYLDRPLFKSDSQCFIGNHRRREEHDFIEERWFDSNRARRNILSRLHGLKTVCISELTKENMKDLQMFCPKIECLSCTKGSVLPRLDYLVHFNGSLTRTTFNQLVTCFPCVTDLSIHVFPSEPILMPASFREGIQSLTLRSSSPLNWNTVFLSPAMKTVTKMMLDGVDTTDIYFKARRLQEFELNMFEVNDLSMETFCSNLSKSLSYAPGLQSFKWKRYSSLVWKVSPSLFYSMNKLRTVVLSQQISNLDEVVEVLCSANPNLETVKIQAVYEQNKKKILDSVSTLTRLQSFVINNHSIEPKGGLTLKELDEFVNSNRVNGKLRFHFSLIQAQYFPAELEVDDVDWNGITWNRHGFVAHISD